jgi:uncharacterized protein YlxP (DUF503 family)
LPVAALTVELQLPDAHSLKDKRSRIRPILDGSRRRFAVAAAEVGHQDRWQRATLSMAAVSGSVHQVTELLDAVERFVWSFPEVEVLSCQRDWLELDADELPDRGAP